MKQFNFLLGTSPKTGNIFFNKFIALSVLVLFSFFNSYAQCNQLVWADEFNGTAVDGAKWQSITGNGCPTLCGFGNGEAQRYDPNQATITKAGAESYLSIEAKYSPNAAFPQQPFSAAKLTTEGKFSTLYGRIEARMKLSSGLGAWPAFWMLPEGGAGTWPFTGEIDIMEAKHKNPKSTDGTLHYDAGGYHFTGRAYGSTTDLSTEFHVYAVEWGPNIIKWFVDDKLFQTLTPKTTVNGGWPFNDRKFYIILNLAVGSLGTPYTSINGVGVEPNPADFPTKLLVDYVRVYTGSYSNGITGDDKVYNNEANKTYSLQSIAGASYNWTVPAGATITSGQGTNVITVNWGTASGDVTVTTTVNGCTNQIYRLPVIAELPLPVEKIYEDFQANRNITYLNKTGVLTEAVANPSATGVNPSALVGKYVRNAAEKYDVLNIKNIVITNANDYVFGRKKLSFDIYTSAPVGTKINMQLENSLVTTPINFPYGRHSSYKGSTTVQNKWETIEFEFEKTIDATTSALSINNVVLLFESGVNSGNTYYFDNLLTKAGPEKPIIATTVIENYDGISKIVKGTSTGTYTPNVANPASSAVNNSAKVAKYVRNAAEIYDVLFFDTKTNIDDAALLKNQTNKIQVDVYSTAPVGTVITLSLENSAVSLPANFPLGRNSTYVGLSTKQNQWETITFYYNSTPDEGTSNLAVNQMVFLFNSGSSTSDTYYFDNIRIGSTKPADTYTPGTVYEDYQNIRNLTFKDANGTYTPAFANPNASGINTSANVGKYVRNSVEKYDNIAFNVTINNIADFKSGTKKFAMDVYTSAPVGSLVTWQAESSASVPSNYPTGRHSVYQAVVKQTNTWHTLIFSYQNAPDASTADNEVNRFVFLFEPNSNSGNTYYFDNLRNVNLVTTENPPLDVLPSPWVSKDLGAVTAAGSGSFANGTFTVKGSGSDIWNNTDEFQYVYQPVTGDAEIIARVNSLTNTNTYAKAGVMFRDVLTGNSKQAMTALTAAAGVEFLSRDAVGGLTIQAGAAVTAPKWVRITRVGNVFTSYYSDNGTAWTQLGTPRTVTMASAIYVGMAVTSHNNGTLTTSVFSDVVVKPITTQTNTLPSPWISKDLGVIAPAGSGTFTNGTFTVKGAGADIWNNTDEFQYVYQPITGDAEIIARVNSLTNTNTYAKAGVMFRDVLTGNSKQAMTALTAAAGVEFLSRDAVGGLTIQAGAAATAPKWVRITRIGNIFTSYYSDNGTAWTQLGTPRTVIMASTIYVGMAVTSHTVGTLTTAAFSNVTVKNIAPVNNNVNLASGKQTVASSTENPTLASNNVTDGINNGTSRWGSDFAEAESSIYVNLGGIYKISRVNLFWEAAYAKNYKVYVSTDNIFTENEVIQTVVNGDGGNDDITAPTQALSGQYVRILCTAKALPYGYSLYELEVYGAAAATAKLATVSAPVASTVNETSSLKIYPYLVNDILKVSLTGNAASNKQIIISDFFGRVLITKNIKADVNQTTVNVSNLTKGIYTFSVISDKGIVSKKFVKE
jgi:beta-glucanase (GH16 family)